jgi:hypothetical protein
MLVITQLFNGILRTGNYSNQWKVLKDMPILKHWKQPEEPHFYRTISLLSVLSKVFERLFQTKFHPILQEKNVILVHQFVFRKKHATTEHVTCIVNIIEDAQEIDQYCTAVFFYKLPKFLKV